jgi:RNA polymerase sigma-70 factor (ECF subfamily)
VKVVPLHLDEKQLIKKSLRKDRMAQKSLYEQYSPKMLSICRMYVKDLHHAEDVMLKGFFKVFKNLKSYKGKGSFEGWIRKIMVREAIDFLRSQKRRGYSEELKEGQSVAENIFERKTEIDEVQKQIDSLPEGYKNVLLLYAVEGYKHHEIAKMLGISENTSKSQLSKARKVLKEKMQAKEKQDEERKIR